jgi:hypothetical protein
MTTAEKELGRDVSMAVARAEMKQAFGGLFSGGLTDVMLDELIVAGECEPRRV